MGLDDNPTTAMFFALLSNSVICSFSFIGMPQKMRQSGKRIVNVYPFCCPGGPDFSLKRLSAILRSVSGTFLFMERFFRSITIRWFISGRERSRGVRGLLARLRMIVYFFLYLGLRAMSRSTWSCTFFRAAKLSISASLTLGETRTAEETNLDPSRIRIERSSLLP